MPESRRHYQLRSLLFAVVQTMRDSRRSPGAISSSTGTPRIPKRCLSPDVFLRVGVRDEEFGSWKTWERGAPHSAVEITSDDDRGPGAWETKLARYRSVGVEELLRFDPDAAPGARLRAWSRVEGDLVERLVRGERTPCLPLGMTWAVTPGETGPTLRLSYDPEGVDLVLTGEEAEQRAHEEERRAREEEHRAHDASSAAAARRIAELEEELRRRGG